MTVRVYIAAASREVERVREAQRMVAERGWVLTLDWLTPMLALMEQGIGDADLSRGEQARYALEDADAIDRADVLWLLAPREPTKGAWWEHGYAYGSDTPIVTSGGCPLIFVALSNRVLDTDAEAPDYIHRMSAEYRRRRPV